MRSRLMMLMIVLLGGAVMAQAAEKVFDPSRDPARDLLAGGDAGEGGAQEHPARCPGETGAHGASFWTARWRRMVICGTGYGRGMLWFA